MNYLINNQNNYFAILGKNPSQGARSPKLWNKVLKKLKRKERMIPIDINKTDLRRVIKKLEKDKNFLGGCIAVPYKETICQILKKNIPKRILKYQSINCLFRDKAGNLTGCNTDGLGALYSLKKKLNIKKKKILVMGLGGTGKAVSASLRDYGCKKVFLTNRSSKKKVFSNIVNYKFLNWNSSINNLNDFDVIINATSAGFLNKNKSPISEKKLKYVKNKFIFDVIYQPRISKLLKMANHNNKILNGELMNMMQAVFAFSIATKIANKNKIFKLMSE